MGIDNYVNFKPPEMFFYMYDVRHAKSLLQVYQGLYSVASLEEVGWKIQAADHLNAKLFTHPFNAPHRSKLIESSGTWAILRFLFIFADLVE